MFDEKKNLSVEEYNISKIKRIKMNTFKLKKSIINLQMII